MMGTLYGVYVRTINEHIKKIYSDSELEEEATIRNFRIVQTEGSRQVTRDTKHYNLQMIIAVGFKVNSERAVQFRKWVNQIAKDYTIKGWVMDDERLKNGGSVLTTEYFDRQLEQIREIRLIQPDNIYQMHGNQISVKTLDLNLSFEKLSKQMDAIVLEYFEGVKKIF